MDSYDHSVDGNVATFDVTVVASYNEVLVTVHNVSASVSVQRGLVVSTDNGANSYVTTGGFVQVPANGAETNQPLATLHGTASTAARSGFAYLPGISIDGIPKPIDLISRDDTGGRFFVASTSLINAIRVRPGLPASGGNLTGGKIFVLG